MHHRLRIRLDRMLLSLGWLTVIVSTVLIGTDRSHLGPSVYVAGILLFAVGDAVKRKGKA